MYFRRLQYHISLHMRFRCSHHTHAHTWTTCNCTAVRDYNIGDTSPAVISQPTFPVSLADFCAFDLVDRELTAVCLANLIANLVSTKTLLFVQWEKRTPRVEVSTVRLFLNYFEEMSWMRNFNKWCSCRLGDWSCTDGKPQVQRQYARTHKPQVHTYVHKRRCVSVLVYNYLYT